MVTPRYLPGLIRQRDIRMSHQNDSQLNWSRFQSFPFRRSLAPASKWFRIGYTAGCLLLAILFASRVYAKTGATAKQAISDTKGQDAPATPSKTPLRVDATKVHRLYLDGEFDAAIAMLEDNLKDTRQYSHEDSVFIFKHLGVMYAAQYHTREKGKYYMNRLLMVEPTAKIMDMYASDMIYMIFKNIQKEYEQGRNSVNTEGQLRVARDTTASSKTKRDPVEASSQPAKVAGQNSGTKTWIWTGVAVATVAAGVGAYVLLSEEQPKATQKEVRF